MVSLLDAVSKTMGRYNSGPTGDPEFTERDYQVFKFKKLLGITETTNIM